MTKKLLIIIMLLVMALSISSCKPKQTPCSHSYDNAVHAPTCIAEGYTEHTCSKCGESYTDTKVPTSAHTYTSAIILPSCTAQGFTEHTCSVCGHKYTNDIIGVTAHRYSNGACRYCSAMEIKENITADTEWFSDEESIVFTITTKEELAGLASLVNSGMIPADVTIYLGGDIDLGFYEWIPIGTAENPFTATFKGEGYTISSMKISANQDYVGLFGNVTGNISDFDLVNSSVYVKNTHNYVGTACGYSQSKISDITASGYVDAPKSSYVGGVAGAIASLAENVKSSVTVCGLDSVGGIAGYVSVESAIFSELENTGAIDGEMSVGGIFGYLTATGSVQTDYISNTGDVKGKIQVGGIIGYANAKTGSTIYNATVKANIEGGYYVGGIIGRTESISLKKCTNEGSTVKATSYLTDETNFYVWLGGYVGSGFEVVDCINTVEINYSSRGNYVGGIAGYLSYGLSNCENTANITAHNNVGGVVGCLNASANANNNKIKNSGAVSGNDSVGGIIGMCNSSSACTFSTIENTGNVTATGWKVGGIIGNLDCGNNTLIAADLSNTGNITAEKHEVGGLFGCAYANQANSIIKHCTSSASIIGAETVGGLIGRTNTEVKDCSNESSTITATSWYTNGDTDYVWLGGYVGDGYKISGCTNNSDITYTGTGVYVGGIVGCATGEIQNCTNNGSISSKSSCVGGIVGYIVTASDCLKYSDLCNSGNITGIDYVSGIIGKIYQQTEKPNLYTNEIRNTCVYDGNKHYNHYYYNITTLNNISNSGDVISSGKYSGGIIGYAFLNSVFDNRTGIERHCDRTCYRNENYCNEYAAWFLQSTNISNNGNISGTYNVGELFGYFSSDATSSITQYVITGQITINGEKLEGDYDIGSNTNLTLSGREIYGSTEESNKTAE